jgi:hypothetical protein
MDARLLHVMDVRRSRRIAALSTVMCLTTLTWACEDGPTSLDVRSLAVFPPSGLVVGVGGTSRFGAVARGPAGLLPTETARWSSTDPGVVTVSTSGEARGVAAGVAEIVVELGGVTATADVEVWIPNRVADYEPGVSYFGRREYVEYIPGELPVILSAGHGGTLRPEEIPNRSIGIVVRDRNTLELTLAVREAMLDQTGYAPHVVISHLDRVKLDPNREIVEAAENDPFAERAWTEYHEYIEQARTEIRVRGEGMYFDMHGHGHPIPRLELGYLLEAERLNLGDLFLDQLSVVQLTSIRELGRDTAIPFSQLLRGSTSFGGFLEAEGVPALPSPAYPRPLDDPYFTGGYSTRRHGSLEDSELVSGIQIEHHFDGLRDTDDNRRDYADRLARAIRLFMLEHIGHFEP